ncbi:MAG: rRNA maturation RNase YbeY [Rickettsiaceae bacterium]
MNIVVEIAVNSKKWQEYTGLDATLFAEIASRILSQYPNFSKVKEFELSILLTDDASMAALNKKFRGKDKATNVLSFPDVYIDWRKIVEFVPDNDYMYLGDIAFGYQTIKVEAEEKSISFQDHFKHLAIHAILHLIGYDHVTEDEAEVMENIEIKVLNTFGIKSPY